MKDEKSGWIRMTKKVTFWIIGLFMIILGTYLALDVIDWAKNPKINHTSKTQMLDAADPYIDHE